MVASEREYRTARAHKADLSREVEAVILKATAWDVENRYQWTEDLWEDFKKSSR